MNKETLSLLKKLVAQEKQIKNFFKKHSNLPVVVVDAVDRELSSIESRISRIEYEIATEKKEKEYAKNTPPEILLQHYFNARSTYMGAGGHNKAEMNQVRTKELKAILDKRGIEIPKYEEGQGVFNGEGSI